MKNYRCQRVADQITRAISNILMMKVADPRLKSITITGTRVTRDIRTAHVYYSALDINVDVDEVGESLQKAAGFIKRELGIALDMKYVPDVRFHYDESLEHGNRIWDKLQEIQDDE